MELRKYRELVGSIKELEDEITRIEGNILSPKITLSDTPKGQSISPDRIGEVIARKIELQNLLCDKHLELIETRKAIETEIEGLDLREQLLCRYRYIEGMTWTQIADKMHYSRKMIYLIHKEAMRKIEHK